MKSRYFQYLDNIFFMFLTLFLHFTPFFLTHSLQQSDHVNNRFRYKREYKGIIFVSMDSESMSISLTGKRLICGLMRQYSLWMQWCYEWWRKEDLWINSSMLTCKRGTISGALSETGFNFPACTFAVWILQS